MPRVKQYACDADRIAAFRERKRQAEHEAQRVADEQQRQAQEIAAYVRKVAYLYSSGLIGEALRTGVLDSRLQTEKYGDDIREEIRQIGNRLNPNNR